MTFSSTGAKSRPVLDEGGFQQLLAAAYVLQQHNDSLRAKDPRLDSAWIFSQISETESLVRQRSIDFAQAAAVVCERLCKMTGAVSVSVCLLKDTSAKFVAEHGVGTRKSGRCIAATSNAAVERLNNGRQFQSLDSEGDARLDTSLCRELGVRSLLAVPVQHAENTQGLIEVRWGLRDALHECDVRTSRLMANLLAEILGREAPALVSSSQTISSGVEAQRSENHESGNASAHPAFAEQVYMQSATDLASHCRVCGRAFSTDEAFCGNCSMPRVAASADGDGLQSKWASMWFMQQAQDTLQERRTRTSERALPPIPHAVSPVRFTEPLQPRETPSDRDHRPESEEWSAAAEPLFTGAHEPLTEEHRIRILEDEPVREANSGAWSRILEHLRQRLAVTVRISRRTATLTLGSIIGVFFLATWLSWTSRPTSRLTWFESLLVDLGLAEVHTHARPAPVYAGRPDVRVWEDVHTALYYCPDSDLYGKTPGGRFSTQRSAQEDQFESATRVACR